MVDNKDDVTMSAKHVRDFARQMANDLFEIAWMSNLDRAVVLAKRVEKDVKTLKSMLNTHKEICTAAEKEDIGAVCKEIDESLCPVCRRLKQGRFSSMCYQNCQYEIMSGGSAGECGAPKPIPEDALCIVLPCGRPGNRIDECGKDPDECRACYVYANILAEQGKDPCSDCGSAWPAEEVSCKDSCGIRKVYIKKTERLGNRGVA